MCIIRVPTLCCCMLNMLIFVKYLVWHINCYINGLLLSREVILDEIAKRWEKGQGDRKVEVASVDYIYIRNLEVNEG